MSCCLEIPRHIPVMTLPNTVLFPHAMLPLYIFEPRYRQMLASILQSDRIMAITALDEAAALKSGHFEPPCKVGTVGVIRACHKNGDETANLVLQGLARVAIDDIVQEDPFRIIEIRILPTLEVEDTAQLNMLKHQLINVIETHCNLNAQLPAEVLHFLRTLDDPDAFIDLAASTLCNDQTYKQKILETPDMHARFSICSEYFQSENRRLQLDHKLRGKLDDENIGAN